MDNPAQDIDRVINEVAGAADPDSQIAAIEKYFTLDAAFIYPIFHIKSSANSRNRIIGTYLFYRCVVRTVRYDVRSVAFDEEHAKLYVELVQLPNFIILRSLLGDWRVKLPMHVHLWLRQARDGSQEGKWLIVKQEDTIMPSDLLGALPHIAPFSNFVFTLNGFLGLLNACLLMFIGLWTPTNPTQRATRLLLDS